MRHLARSDNIIKNIYEIEYKNNIILDLPVL